MLIISNEYVLEVGFTIEQISFFNDLLMHIIQLLSYISTESWNAPPFGLTFETMIQWQPLTCRI